MSELLAKLKPNPVNPRKITLDKMEGLKASIRAFPEMLEKRPIVYDENFMILGGQRRYEALKALAAEGMEIKSTYFQSAAGWTKEQKEEFTIKDNAHDGEWDIDILKENWSNSPIDKWGLDFVTNWGKEGAADNEKNTNKEIDPDKLLENGVCCPRCGFEFEPASKE